MVVPSLLQYSLNEGCTLLPAVPFWRTYVWYLRTQYVHVNKRYVRPPTYVGCSIVPHGTARKKNYLPRSVCTYVREYYVYLCVYVDAKVTATNGATTARSVISTQGQVY